jgi:hypothetical protein
LASEWRPILGEAWAAVAGPRRVWAMGALNAAPGPAGCAGRPLTKVAIQDLALGHEAGAPQKVR